MVLPEEIFWKMAQYLRQMVSSRNIFACALNYHCDMENYVWLNLDIGSLWNKRYQVILGLSFFRVLGKTFRCMTYFSSIVWTHANSKFNSWNLSTIVKYMRYIVLTHTARNLHKTDFPYTCTKEAIHYPLFGVCFQSVRPHYKKCWVKYNQWVSKYWTKHMLGCFQSTLTTKTLTRNSKQPNRWVRPYLTSAGLYLTQHWVVFNPALFRVHNGKIFPQFTSIL